MSFLHSFMVSCKNSIHFYNTEHPQERYGNKAPPTVREEALKATNPAQYPIAENKRIQAYKAKYAA